jgi:hypothetical protein
MRLTLRTMLAYLDNVLEPADAELLGKKINESDFASGLVQRVKGAMRKLRMDAPKIDGKGMGNDANTVSDYLDSSLPQDRVSDFERVCLESDKHLCEVAACHQILTLVLGKPADVSPELRDKIYALADPTSKTDAKPAAQAATMTLADAKTVVPPPVRSPNGQPAVLAGSPEVPEYLRGGNRASIWPIVFLAAAAAVMGLITLGLLSRFGGAEMVARIFRGKPPVAMTDTPDAAPAAITESPAASSSEKSTSPVVDSAAATVSNPLPDSATADVAPTSRATSPDAAPSASPPASPPVAVTEVPASDPPGPAASPTPALPPPLQIEPPGPAVAAATPVRPAPTAPAAAPPAAKDSMDVGRYTSDSQILATLDPDAGLWYAKQPLTVLSAGERLIALPPFRPQIALPSSVQVTFAGEGSVLMEAPSENGVPRMTVEYGRLLVLTGGAAGAQIELDLAGVQGVATLVDADSAMAIKVSRWLPQGLDPEVAGGMPVVEIFNTHGRITWRETGHEKVEIPTHFVRIYVGIDTPENQGPYATPEWIDSRGMVLVDRDAAVRLERMIDPAKPLNLWLQEMTQDRRIDVRMLAARCLAYLNEFEPIIRELSDTRQSAYWFAEIEALRHALSRSPETAAAVREALARLRSADAKELYRLLWSYSQEQLDRGDDFKLVKLLEHDQLDIRVLTFWNLFSITGAQEFYRPEKSPQQPQMRTAIQNWKERLAKRQIAYKYPPSPVENYKPLAAPAAEVRPGSPGVPPRDR